MRKIWIVAGFDSVGHHPLRNGKCGFESAVHRGSGKYPAAGWVGHCTPCQIMYRRVFDFPASRGKLDQGGGGALWSSDFLICFELSDIGFGIIWL